MKRIFLALLCCIVCASSDAQINLTDDTFSFRHDAPLSYRLFVKNNDTILFKLKIYKIEKTGPSANFYTVQISDTNFTKGAVFISISDTFSLSTYTGKIKYFGRDTTGLEDSATISFSRIPLTPEVYPGESNKDNIVNHLDIFPIGLLYGKYGQSRHNLDTNLNFIPKGAANWIFQTGATNGKFADVDGNSIIDTNDFLGLIKNLGKSHGTYTPKLSDTLNATSTISINVPDTFTVKADTPRIFLPLTISNSSGLNTYGLGYSLSVQNRDKISLQDTFFPKYSFEKKSNVWTDNSIIFYVEDKISLPNHSNIAFCRTNLNNGGMGGGAGIVEIIVDDILIGLKEPADIGRMKINIKDVALIDKNYNYIPIRPISKTIYIRKATSGISIVVTKHVAVYPTIVDRQLTIEKKTAAAETFSVYNSIGQVIQTGMLHSQKTLLDNIIWTTGIYYLKIESSPEVLRLQKM